MIISFASIFFTIAYSFLYIFLEKKVEERSHLISFKLEKEEAVLSSIVNRIIKQDGNYRKKDGLFA